MDRDISLLGVTLCGSENDKYSVTMSITNLNKKEDLILKSGSFSSVSIKSEKGSYYGFNILFDRYVFLKKNVRYRVEASITGPNSCSCQNGQDFVLCSGVNFNFRICCSGNNGTNVENGQFPEFLFIV